MNVTITIHREKVLQIVEDRGNGNADFGACLPHLEDEPLPSVDTLEVAGCDLLQIRETQAGIGGEKKRHGHLLLPGRERREIVFNLSQFFFSERFFVARLCMDAVLSERIGRDDIHVESQIQVASEDTHLFGDGIDRVAMLSKVRLIVHQEPVVNVGERDIRMESSEPHVRVPVADLGVLADGSLLDLLFHPGEEWPGVRNRRSTYRL